MYSLVKLISLLIVVDCICHHNQCSERNCYLTVYLFSTTHGIFFFMFQKNGVLAENENANELNWNFCRSIAFDCRNHTWKSFLNHGASIIRSRSQKNRSQFSKMQSCSRKSGADFQNSEPVPNIWRNILKVFGLYCTICTNVQSVKDVVRRFELGTYSPCIDSFEH